MSIQDLGAIGELIGAVAVLVTLIYLSLQIRQNSAITRAQTHQSIASERASALRMLVENSALAEASVKAMEGREINDEERRTLYFFTVLNLRFFENELYQHSQGMLTDDELEVTKKLLMLPHMQLDIFERRGIETFSPIAQDEIRELIAKRKGGT